MGCSLREMLEEKLQRYEELERMMLDPTVLANSSRLASVARQRGQLAKLATRYREFKQLNEQIRQTQELLEGPDPELRQLAEAELPQLKARRDRLWDELLELTLGDEDLERKKMHPGDPSGHWRGRSRLVRPRPLQYVQTLL